MLDATHVSPNLSSALRKSSIGSGTLPDVLLIAVAVNPAHTGSTYNPLKHPQPKKVIARKHLHTNLCLDTIKKQ
jgi:hypothetical protein